MSLTDPAASAGACLLCKSTGDDIVLVDNGHVGRRCDCGIVYIDPRPQPDVLDNIQDFHSDSYYQYPAFLRFAFIKDVCERHLLPGERRMLDVGAGHGHLAVLARGAGYHVAAIEPDPACADELRARGIETEQALLKNTRYEDGRFDIIFHIDLLSHFANPADALATLRRLVKRGGLVCFEVGIFGGLSKSWYRWMGRAGFPQHLWFYSYENLDRLFRESGLEIVDRRNFSLWASTIVSSIGTRFLSGLMPPLRQDVQSAQPTRGLRRAYDRLQHHLRYTVGKYTPTFGGPQSCFFALRANDIA